MIQEALEKLDSQLAEAEKVNRYSGIMAGPVAECLKDFCRQDEEFADAVVQGGTFSECMTAVSKGCGRALSDLEAYRRAVQFYFPGADIRGSRTIDLCASVRDAEPAPEHGGGMVLDLTKFL